MENSFKVSYVTTLPKIGNAPIITITGQQNHRYKIECYELSELDNYKLPGILVCDGYCNTNEVFTTNAKQYYTSWRIIIKDENDEIVYQNLYYIYNKPVFIKFDSYALGDTIAWIPYVEAFRKKYNCNPMICSTFHNDLVADAYPNILFVKPNTVIENIYSQIYVGASNDNGLCYSPIKVDFNPLQAVGSSILGLNHTELRPDLSFKYRYTKSIINEKYVTLSEYGSGENKHWKAENGWQDVVDYLSSVGYKVMIISKERTKLTGVIDRTGDIALDERAIDMLHAKFHIGVSSGLSWLAWALGKHVVMISDVTPIWHEFQTDITRISANELEHVNYLAEGQTTSQTVINKLKNLVVC